MEREREIICDKADYKCYSQIILMVKYYTKYFGKWILMQRLYNCLHFTLHVIQNVESTVRYVVIKPVAIKIMQLIM